MANLKLALLILVFGLSAFTYARSAAEAAQAANEVDTAYCTKSGANMIDYCTGYCELQSGESCTSATYSEEADSNDIDLCECTCGVDDLTYTYESVPCGLDLNQYGTPSGEGYSGSGNASFCCLPAFLLGMIGFATIRK
jgi:hypothetical protein